MDITMNIPSHDFLFSWSSLSWRSRKRNAKNACFVFKAWHGGSHIQNSGPLIMFIFPEEAFKNLFFLQVNPHEANFYFPIKIVVPINMIFWNTNSVIEWCLLHQITLSNHVVFFCVYFFQHNEVTLKALVIYINLSEIMVNNCMYCCWQ